MASNATPTATSTKKKVVKKSTPKGKKSTPKGSKKPTRRKPTPKPEPTLGQHIARGARVVGRKVGETAVAMVQTVAIAGAATIAVVGVNRWFAGR